MALKPGVKNDWDYSTEEEDGSDDGVDSEGSITNNYEELV